MRSVVAEQRETRIVEMLSSGRHAEAFEQLVEVYESRVFRLCCALLRNRASAEDAAQESLVRVWKNLAGYDGRAALSTWIYAITRNRCLTALERRRQELSLSDESVAAQVEDRAAPQPGDDEPHAALRELVHELPENYRRCLVLYYFEEQSVETVAGLLAIPVGTVKTNLHRARALLARRLKALGLDDARLWLEDGHEHA
jgi:RNA polymerase sigma-70 factor (ECF subfamily)